MSDYGYMAGEDIHEQHKMRYKGRRLVMGGTETCLRCDARLTDEEKGPPGAYAHCAICLKEVVDEAVAEMEESGKLGWEAEG